MIQDALLLIPPPHMADGWDVSKLTCQIGWEVWVRQSGDVTMGLTIRQHHNDSRTASQRRQRHLLLLDYHGNEVMLQKQKESQRERKEPEPELPKETKKYLLFGSLQTKCPPSPRLLEQHQSVRSMMFQFLLTCLKKEEKAEGLHRMIIWFWSLWDRAAICFAFKSERHQWETWINHIT